MKNILLKKYLTLFRNGEMEAFPVIYCEFEESILFYSKQSDSEDVRQELTLFLIELLYKLNPDSFSTDESDTLCRYISVALKHKYITLIKNKKIRKKHNLSFGEVTVSDGRCFEEEIDTYLMLHSLSKKQRKVIIYKYFLNFTDIEIAEMMGISRQAVNRIKNRGLEMLRFLYLEEG